MAEVELNKQLRSFIAINHRRVSGDWPDSTIYRRFMKQLKDLVMPKRRVKTYTIEELQEVLDDIQSRGVIIYSIGILLIEGLVYSYFYDRQRYEKIIDRLKKARQESQLPQGFSWE